jgi:hypothetical protein
MFKSSIFTMETNRQKKIGGVIQKVDILQGEVKKRRK